MPEPKYITDSNPELHVAPPLSKTDDESEGAHLRRVASELSGSGKERIAHLRRMLKSRRRGDQISAAVTLGKNGSQKAVQVLRDLLVSGDERSWRLAIHGLRSGGAREGWLCLESVALEDAGQLASTDNRRANTAFKRLMAMGRTKMMDRLFRAADGHSKSISGDVARQFSANAVATLSDLHRNVLELRLGLFVGAAATPAETAFGLGIGLGEVRALEREAWQSIHAPTPVTAR
ncbi:MAG: hypothetical protein O6922_00735 [Chloroflexi bacterium]|nr:hypothetical protein [Chloroflexota bacterium]